MPFSSQPEHKVARPFIYLDHAATTPVHPAAKAAFERGLALWANPSSPHAAGRRARAALEDARQEVADRLDWTGEVIFTSGATEAIQLALAGWAGRCLVSAVEHEALLRAAPEAPRIPVLSNGHVDPEQLGPMVERVSGLPLVAIQHVNSETGVIQPLGELAQALSRSGALLLADCSQSAGRMPLPPADMIVLSGHKLGAGPGAGALLVRDLNLLRPTGGQESGYRPGTENLPAILALAAALKASGDAREHFVPWATRGWAWDAQLLTAVEEMGGYAVCGPTLRSPLVSSYYMPGVSAAAQLMRFDAMGIAVSAGSACSSGTMRRSHVLEALEIPPQAADCIVRISYGQSTTEADAEAFRQAWMEVAQSARLAA